MPARQRSAAPRNGPYHDLCSTCDSRGNCMQPRPPGGIWRCGSYREGRGE
jgi:hypothetical protein